MDENVLLLFGGNSFEHDISIITALTIFNKATACKYKLLPLYLAKNNKFYILNRNRFNINLFKNLDIEHNKDFKNCFFKKDSYVYYKQNFIERKIKIDF